MKELTFRKCSLFSTMRLKIGKTMNYESNSSDV